MNDWNRKRKTLQRLAKILIEQIEQTEQRRREEGHFIFPEPFRLQQGHNNLICNDVELELVAQLVSVFDDLGASVWFTSEQIFPYEIKREYFVTVELPRDYIYVLNR